MKRLVSDVWDGLRFQPGRSALSALAVCVGMTSLTILLAVMGGLREKSRELVEDMGANVFVIMPGKRSEILDGELTLGKRDMLAESLEAITPSALRTFSLQVANFPQPIRAFAVDDSYFRIHNTSLLSGRQLDDLDHEKAARVAIVADTLAHDANWQLGQSIYLGNALFTVIGIIERPGSALEKETSDTSFVPDDSTLFVPLASSVAWMSKESINRETVDLIEVKVDKASLLESKVSAASEILCGRNSSDAFKWITPDLILENVKRLERIIGLTAGSVALLCLALGGTTLMSLMVANVRDRILEIALRQTLGATKRDISMLFITEACLVTVTGSIVGIATAAALISVTRDQLMLPVYMGFGIFLAPLLTAVAMGVCFSYVPARMATAITPAEALRND